MTKKAKATFDIKKKLMGAVAMLLVATIMMVSATYAWFTLSTAPEVKGISTTVGGNGNLEIALRVDANQPQSKVGDSSESQLVEKANITWGNLVDLSKSEYYGTNSLNLYPAKLDLDENGKVTDKILAFPIYGVDGRVKEITNTRTYIHTFDGVSFSDKLENATDPAAKRPTLGVRAIGTSSGLSEEAQIFRAAKSQLNADNTAAKTAVESILNNNGSGITTIIIKHAKDDDNYSAADVATVKATANAMDAAVGKIEIALIQALDAYSKSGYTGGDKTAINEVLDAVNDAQNPVPLLTAIQGKELSTALSGVLAQFSALSTQVAGIKTAANGLSDAGATWAQISPVMNAMLNSDGVTITGKTVQQIWDEAKETDDTVSKSDAVRAYAANVAMNGPGIVVGIPGTDTGALRAFADFVGKYSSDVQIPSSEFGIAGVNISAKLQVETNLPSAYLPGIANGVSLLPAPSTGGSGSNDEIIDDVYGYALDLWVRTNAPTGTKLRLQESGVDRIYTDGTSNNANTQGEGSFMEFDFNNDFNATKVLSLMNAIRLVFTDGEGTILCYGELNTVGAEPDTTNNNVKAPIKLYTKTVENNEEVKTPTTDLTTLNQSEAKKLTVIVYLDGETVDNRAAANAAIATTGRMNIQFITDVELVPMENSALKNPAETETEPQASQDPEQNP